MTAPDWINGAVGAFGRQMGLAAFALNERGAAGVRFENGVALRLEYAEGALMMTVGLRLPPEERVLVRLLAEAHPLAQGAVQVRAAYMSRTGEAVLVARIFERDIETTALEAAFRELWARGERLWRAVG